MRLHRQVGRPCVVESHDCPLLPLFLTVKIQNHSHCLIQVFEIYPLGTQSLVHNRGQPRQSYVLSQPKDMIPPPGPDKISRINLARPGPPGPPGPIYLHFSSPGGEGAIRFLTVDELDHMTSKCPSSRRLLLAEKLFVVLEQECAIEKMTGHPLETALPRVRLVKVVDVRGARPALGYGPQGSQLEDVVRKVEEAQAARAVPGPVRPQEGRLGVRVGG